jgi:hypothetical protein
MAGFTPLVEGVGSVSPLLLHTDNRTNTFNFLDDIGSMEGVLSSGVVQLKQTPGSVNPLKESLSLLWT